MRRVEKKDPIRRKQSFGLRPEFRDSLSLGVARIFFRFFEFFFGKDENQIDVVIDNGNDGIYFAHDFNYFFILSHFTWLIINYF